MAIRPPALIVFVAIVSTIGALRAQSAISPSSVQSPASPSNVFPSAVKSPEVHADHTVTFRLRAPQAKAVELVGEVLQGKPPQAMSKDDQGVWSATIGPLPPEIWIYNFRVEGVDLPDPANISLMPRAAGLANSSSFVEIPGEEEAFL